MNVQIENIAIIILSDGNNPSLLNPDLLERNKIVPKDWGVENVLVTPPFAQVVYKNGLRITVDQNKIQFVCSNPHEINWKVELPRIAIAYITLLPHVAYRAVGLNFRLSSSDYKASEAEMRVISELLKDGPWLKLHNGITGAIVELQYRSSSPNFNVKVGVGGELLRFDINFHHDFEPKQNEERIAFISTLEARPDEFSELIKSLSL